MYDRVLLTSASFGGGGAAAADAVYSADEEMRALSLEKKHRGMINKIKEFLENN